MLARLEEALQRAGFGVLEAMSDERHVKRAGKKKPNQSAFGSPALAPMKSAGTGHGAFRRIKAAANAPELSFLHLLIWKWFNLGSETPPLSRLSNHPV
jgi:hypothetical protein